jgi:NADH-quinone oxidoreductase subunit A
MRTDFAFIGVMLIVTLVLMAGTLFAASLLRPKKPSKTKQDTYECGIETVGDTWVQFRVQYYIFALIFVLFDVEAILLFPIAVAYNALTFFAIVETVIFIVLLLGAILYAWRKGALQWN